MNQLVFISDKADVAAACSDLQNFDKVSQVLTEQFGFKIRHDRHGIFDFFYHCDFKESIMEYSGGELRVKNPSNAFLERMIKIAQAFPSAKVIGDDGGWYVSSNDVRYPEIVLEDGIEASVTDETVSRTWLFLKVGMAVSALFCLAVVLNKFVF
ncbi:hypothetical protein [Neisseria iguanae]|uniref:Uncharacterized protein n=1 Tax=Neisseria iguanae TaxID=90242 RepID=A0A2P7U2Z0_9NEIS|nr:hypothetical protein [Neisseria iguanae]PSJ81358.1 hypothetical protein C7N83_00805 [Neisseria iguanae]